jgi:hypothetical protein
MLNFGLVVFVVGSVFTLACNGVSDLRSSKKSREARKFFLNLRKSHVVRWYRPDGRHRRAICGVVTQSVVQDADRREVSWTTVALTLPPPALAWRVGHGGGWRECVVRCFFYRNSE